MPMRMPCARVNFTSCPKLAPLLLRNFSRWGGTGGDGVVAGTPDNADSGAAVGGDQGGEDAAAIQRIMEVSCKAPGFRHCTQWNMSVCLDGSLSILAAFGSIIIAQSCPCHLCTGIASIASWCACFSHHRLHHMLKIPPWVVACSDWICESPVAARTAHGCSLWRQVPWPTWLAVGTPCF